MHLRRAHQRHALAHWLRSSPRLRHSHAHPAPRLPSRSRSALRGGSFFKEVLPAMYDANIINQKRFAELTVRGGARSRGAVRAARSALHSAT